MNPSIERLEAIFRENSLHNLQGLRRMSAGARNHLDCSVYAWFGSFKETHLETIESGLNLCLAIGTKIDDCLLGDPIKTAIKRLSFYSQTGVLLTSKFRHPGVRGKLIPDAWYYLTLAYLPLIRNGMLTILPKGMTYLQTSSRIKGETFLVVGDKAKNIEKTWFLFKEEIPSLKVIDFSEIALQKQMLEVRPDYTLQTKPAGYIYLPHLSNVPVETLVLMRQHHGDTFQRYNLTVERFFSGTPKAKTESRFLELMHETDEGIRKIDAELEKISSSKALQALGITLKLGAAALCPLLPKGVSEGALSILGTGVATDTARYFQLRCDQKAVSKSSPFFFPWLVHSESKKFSL